MFLNYFLIGTRILWRNRLFSFINLIGLSLGLMAFLFLAEFIGFEQSFNQFHTRLPNLYRLCMVDRAGNSGEIVAPGVAPFAKQEFGEIVGFCRLAPGIGTGVVTYGDQVHREEAILFTEGSFFEVFSFPLVGGTAKDFGAPNRIALSESHANKYFGSEPALGKTIVIDNQFGRQEYTVACVFVDFPANSDIQASILLNLETLANPANLNGNEWAALDGLDSQYLMAVMLLEKEADAEALTQKMNTWLAKVAPDAEETFLLQPLAHLHLPASLQAPYPTYGQLELIYLLAAVAALILAVAWFNYVNLSTAAALQRAKEIGIRKVIGASRAQLIGQFLGESFLLNALAFVIGIILVLLLQDVFNELAGRPLSLSGLAERHVWVWGGLFILFGTLASGGYKAFALSQFQPVTVLKGKYAHSRSGTWLRKTLVVFQFGIAISLMASTYVLYAQLQYVNQKDLGLETEQLLIIEGPSVRQQDFAQQRTGFHDELNRLPFVQQFSISGCVPGKYFNFQTAGIALAGADEEAKKISYSIAIVDQDFAETYKLGLVAGRFFRLEECSRSWQEVERVVINEKTARLMGFGQPADAVGKTVEWGKSLEIIGVVQDYHHLSLKDAIAPTIFWPQINAANYTIRLQTKDMQAHLQQLGRLYRQYYPGNPFDYYFLDDQYQQLYETEKRYAELATVSTTVAISIACMGLFGLALFSMKQRTKEIGIRKVLGASLGSIFLLLCKEYFWLIGWSAVIGIPIANYVLTEWLQTFAYHIDLHWWMFALPTLVTLLIALFAIGGQSYRTASYNPIDSLRSE